MKCFQLSTQNGLLADLSTDPFASQFFGWSSTQALDLPGGDTHLGFVYQGDIQIDCSSGCFSLMSGMYFSIPGEATITPLTEDAQGIVMTRNDYTGFFQIGGPIEETGRLRYIDGCTDSLLISPVLVGDPCLNLLHIPANTQQTAHTHPSLRLGMIVSGSGTCVTPVENFPLSPGTVFYIPADDQHSFHTGENEDLRVIAYHPDSDFGPAHEDHPMINKTIIS